MGATGAGCVSFRGASFGMAGHFWIERCVSVGMHQRLCGCVHVPLSLSPCVCVCVCVWLLLQRREHVWVG